MCEDGEEKEMRKWETYKRKIRNNKTVEKRLGESGESLVTSLNLSKILKAKRVKQDSFLYWVGWKNIWSTNKSLTWTLDRNYSKSINNRNLNGWWELIETFSAFSVTELQEILPPSYLVYRLENNMWNCAKREEVRENIKTPPLVELDMNPANACAKMVLYLIADLTSAYVGYAEGEKE